MRSFYAAQDSSKFRVLVFTFFIITSLQARSQADTSRQQISDTIAAVADTVEVNDKENVSPDNTETPNGKVLFGFASFYAEKFNGRYTASGEIFNQSKLTCACNKLPFGTRIRVTNIRNGKTVVVKVNDRLHPKMKRLVDLTRAAARQLGFLSSGLTKVKVEILGKESISSRLTHKRHKRH